MSIRIRWASDIHLDSLHEFQIDHIGKTWAASCDHLLLAGDLGTQRHFPLLKRFLGHFHGKVSFTLGNHDYWYGSIAAAEKKAASVEKNGLAAYLDNHNFLRFDNTAVIGQYVWYDLSLGKIAFSPPEIDTVLDFKGLAHGSYSQEGHWLPSKLALSVFQHAALIGAERARKKAIEAIAAGCKKVILVTHVPPFAKSCFYKGHPTDERWLPVMTNEYTFGAILRELALENPDVQFEVLSGHTHNKSEYQVYENLVTKVAPAWYGDPILCAELKIV